MPLKNKMFVLLLLSCLLTFHKSHADIPDSIMEYQAVMNLFDSCSYHDLSNYDTLYKVTVVYTRHGEHYKYDYYGWVDKWDTAKIMLFSSAWKEIAIDRKDIYNIEPLSITETMLESLLGKDDDRPSMGDYDKGYLISLWLHKKGFTEFSKKMLVRDSSFLMHDIIVNDFAFRYYNQMLQTLCNGRNYEDAIRYGNHLSKEIFKNYEYRGAVVGLTEDLKTRKNDFKEFHLPDSTEWLYIKSKLNRVEQISFLCERLKLLNCIQPGQPADISYTMFQYAVSYDESQKLNFSYWDYNAQYTVLNPFNELLEMKLSIKEMELLLPYLLKGNYLPTYTYFRDFMHDRRIHKLHFVVNNLIYQIANRHFFSNAAFDSMSIDKREIEVEKIKKWCEENGNLSPEQLVLQIMNTTDNWTDFSKALSVAKEMKSDSIVPIVERRFSDFDQKFLWPGPRGEMAETLYQLGDVNDMAFMTNWNDTTEDDWVRLWTSMFLVKYDKEHYKNAMNKLELVLGKCDGVSYYPRAMDLLLSLNDARAMKLAEGILNKTNFQQQLLFSDYFLNFIKELLLKKSDYTYQFLYEKLNGTYKETNVDVLNNGPALADFLGDNIAWAVGMLRYDAPKFNMEQSSEARKEYNKQLAGWLKIQYNLLKNDKPNDLKLTVKKENAPVWLIDSPH